MKVVGSRSRSLQGQIFEWITASVK